MSTTHEIDDEAAGLRAAMVRGLREQGAIRSEAVAAAFAAVPREAFGLGGDPLAKVYNANDTLAFKVGDQGRATSVTSAAHLQASMIEQADIRPGQKVLEVGSGGYNAALLAALGCEVTTMDIDPEVVAATRERLAATGYDDVNVVLGDAEYGVPDGAPYDRIIVTAGAFTIPSAWLEQLAGDGRLVVPLRWRGLTRSIAFDRDGGGLLSRSYLLCAFVPFQGAGEHAELTVPIEDDQLFLTVDDRSRSFDQMGLYEAARMAPVTVRSGVPFDLPDELAMWLMTSTPDLVTLYASQALIDDGRFNPAAGRGVPVLVRSGSFAYRTKVANDRFASDFEVAVIAHGPNADAVAQEYVELLRRWGSVPRERGGAIIRYLPDPVADVDALPGVVSIKPGGVITVVWE